MKNRKMFYFLGTAVVAMIAMLLIYFALIATGVIHTRQNTVVFCADDAEKLYDGTPLTCDTWHMIGGELQSGHYAVGTVSGSQTLPGTSSSQVSIVIYDNAGNDVTGEYTVTCQPGVLKVRGYPISIVSASADKTYDKQPLTAAEWHMESGTLLEGHTLAVSTVGTITNAGEVPNDILASVVDEHGNDVSYLYEITRLPGTLTVNKRNLTIASASAYKYYDGEPLTANAWSVVNGSTAEGDNLSVTVSGSITEIGMITNMLTYTLVDENGNDNTANYKINSSLGFLEVRDKMNSLSPESMGIGPPGPGEQEDQNNTLYAKVKPEIGGTVYLRYQACSDFDGSDWTAGIPYEGETSVNPLYYSAIALSEAGYQPTEMRIETYVLDHLAPYYSSDKLGDTLNDVKLPSIGNKYTIPYYECDYLNLPSPITLTGEQKADEERYREYVYANYLGVSDTTVATLDEIIAKQHFNKKDPYVIMKVASYIQSSAYYNLNAEFPEDVEDKVVYFLTVSREGFCQHFASAATLLYRQLGIPARYVRGLMADVEGGVWNEIYGDRAHAWVEVYLDGFGWVPVEVTGSDEPPERVELIVKPMEPEDNGRYYDGTPLYVENMLLVNSNLLPGHEITSFSFIDGDITYVGSKMAMVDVSSIVIVDEFGNDVTDQYKITSLTTEIKIRQRVIKMNVGSMQIVDRNFTGALKMETYTIDTRTSLTFADGDTLDESELIYTGSQYGFGKTPNDIDPSSFHIVNAEGMDVTDQYSITTVPGVLQVAYARIAVTTGSTSRVYTGTAIRNTKYDYSDQVANLQSDHAFGNISMTTSITNVGRVQNVPNVEIVDKTTGFNVTDQYLIVNDNCGYLAVTPRAITVTSNSAEKAYDGTPLVEHSYTVTSGVLMSGHSVTMNYTGEQTMPGYSANEFTGLKITDRQGNNVTSNYKITTAFGQLHVGFPKNN